MKIKIQGFAAEEINTVTNTTFKYLYEKTIEREDIIKNKGYKLITMWESNFILNE